MATSATTALPVNSTANRQQRNTNPCIGRLALSLRALFVFQVVTQTYVTVCHLLPFALHDYSPWVQAFVSLVFCYFAVAALVNWSCIMLYSSEYVPSMAGPHNTQTDTTFDMDAPSDPRFPPATRSSLSLAQHRQGNGHVALDVTGRDGSSSLPWKHCKRCDIDTPPRTNHCEFCGVCIVRRDHHCFFVGCCIGHWNQRFFVVTAAYTTVFAYLCFLLTVFYLWHHHGPEDRARDIALPVMIIQWLSGNMSNFKALLIFHVYMQAVFGPVGNMYWFSQMCIISTGKTQHEIRRKKNVKVTSSLCSNFRVAFGDHCLLSFLFPAHLVYKHKHNGIYFDGVEMEDPETKTAAWQ